MSDNSEVAGRGTDTLPGGTSHSVPMKAHGLVYGVLAFVFRGTLTLCSPLRPRVSRKPRLNSGGSYSYWSSNGAVP
jgi:K+-sensing histidine kinase KdpD